ncbi:MAG TPA: imidazolonepropionase [Pyrinomonadaceae bacterium]|nr:imidazolonepropionase [Acidobacteriota bacterium]HQZ96473.1 imidazolonepropionase [Pyrinomonadaceae bacterium]
MPTADLIIHNAGQLVTCASGGRPKRRAAMLDVGMIANGAVAIAAGKIVGVGTTETILNDFSAFEMIDAGGNVVCPGFVDPHTHIVYAGDRLNEFELKIKGADYLEILTNGGGIISTVRHTREASVEQLVERSLKRLDKMLACGTTTCEIKTGYGLDTETELKMLAVIEVLDNFHAIDIVPTFLAAHAVPPEFKGNADGYVDLICGEMLPLAWKWYKQSHFATNGIPFYADVFTEKNAYDIEQTRRVLETAIALGFGIKAHVDQFTNLGGSKLGIELNAASIDHLDAISDTEIEMLAASNTVGVVIPTENFNGGKTQFADARKLIDSGCSLALSTDYNPGSAPCPSMPMAMAIACRYQKLLPAEALNACTINAAYSIGKGSDAGSIEVGKSADLVLTETTDYRALMYEFGTSTVAKILKGGVLVHGS